MTSRKRQSKLSTETHLGLWLVGGYLGNRFGNAVDEEIGGFWGVVLGFLASAAVSWLIEQAG